MGVNNWKSVRYMVFNVPKLYPYPKDIPTSHTHKCAHERLRSVICFGIWYDKKLL